MLKKPVKNKKVKAPKFLVIDCETDSFKYSPNGWVPSPFIWDAYHPDLGHNIFYFEKHLIDYLKSLGKTIVYAHNGGKFDFHFISDYFDSENLFTINGRISKTLIKGSKVELRDSYNIIPVSLGNYKKDDFEYWKMDLEHRDKYMEEIIAYLKSDCENLYELIDGYYSLMKKFDIKPKLTMASSAFELGHKLIGLGKPIQGLSDFIKFKQYYYGGRTQALIGGVINEHFNSIDINSSYPYAMLSKHPISPEHDTREYNKKESIRGYRLYNVSCISNGVFPYRSPINNQISELIFPDDNIKRDYKITGWELQAALDTNTIRDYQIKTVTEFSLVTSFSNYVKPLYKERSIYTKDHHWNLLLKLLLNSFYGKYGMDSRNHVIQKLVKPQYIQAALDDETLVTEMLEESKRKGTRKELNGYMMEYKYRNTEEKKGFVERHKANLSGFLGNWALIEVPIPESDMMFFNVATAASITGLARANLFRTMHAIEKDKGTVLYTDTDSISYIGDTNKIDVGKELGQWEVEGKFKKGGIAGKKLYAFYGDFDKKKNAWKTRSKGGDLKPQEIMELSKDPKKVIKFFNNAPTYSIHKKPYYRVVNFMSTLKHNKRLQLAN